MKTRLVVIVVALVALCSSFTAHAQSKKDSSATRLPGSNQIVREGDENPMLTIGKSTGYGFMTGALLAGAISLVADDTEELSKWLIVGGTFVGFGAGIHHVATRPKPHAALLQFNAGGLAKVSFPPAQLQWQNGQVTGFKVSVATLSL